ncbi:head completion/stabilization protein [Pseudomonas resinovorans]|uniref:head completion/stabilization protein n=1 Tax=Metapseudomonas resinovorans TaxID=53412 RepID=UPI00237F11F0|nr:head completion/stabilization protein [Pseudomonas resinovorans]MDE3738597.1 head completion/stabilization protein [Pseudomonas resinovorans]
MSGFIAGGTPTAFTISNDGWWPDIDGQDMRAVLRLDASITDARLKAAALSALLHTNRELAPFKARHQGAGHTSLQSIPADQVDGQSRLEILYRRALYCGAGAELTERYRALDSSAEGHDKADALTPSIDELRRDQRWAIRDLLGQPRTTVELI